MTSLLQNVLIKEDGLFARVHVLLLHVRMHLYKLALVNMVVVNDL